MSPEFGLDGGNGRAASSTTVGACVSSSYKFNPFAPALCTTVGRSTVQLVVVFRNCSIAVLDIPLVDVAGVSRMPGEC